MASVEISLTCATRRRQYVSWLQKWGLRRYGLHQNTKEASPAPTTKARQFDGSSGEDAALSKSLRYHQPKCRLCERASPNCPEIQQSFQLAIKNGALSEDEVRRKLDLADFYLAAKNFDDAWSPYAEVVWQFADPQLSQKAYLWKITSVRGIEDEGNVKDSSPALQQSGSATSTAGPQPDTLLTDGESDPRPASCVSVDMLATPRSSLSSSKASLRPFKRLGRVANSLLKRGGSGANQRPSEAMNRDSHSSWSLRRLTGASYLSGISGTPEDYEPEGDTVMEDAGLMD